MSKLSSVALATALLLSPSLALANSAMPKDLAACRDKKEGDVCHEDATDRGVCSASLQCLNPKTERPPEVMRRGCGACSIDSREGPSLHWAAVGVLGFLVMAGARRRARRDRR